MIDVWAPEDCEVRDCHTRESPFGNWRGSVLKDILNIDGSKRPAMARLRQ
jgi:hypothetical protein